MATKAGKSPAYRELVLRRDGFRCCECGVRCHHQDADVHHLIPRSLGGSYDPGNLITLCDGCHAAHHPNLQVRLSRRLSSAHAGDVALVIAKSKRLGLVAARLRCLQKCRQCSALRRGAFLEEPHQLLDHHRINPNRRPDLPTPARLAFDEIEDRARSFHVAQRQAERDRVEGIERRGQGGRRLRQTLAVSKPVCPL